MASKDLSPTLPSFSRSLPMALLKARESVMRHFRQSLRQHDLTEQQWRVLRALTTTDESEISALAEATFLLAPSLSRILRDLERRDLIARRADDLDQRRSWIAVTHAGLALIDEVRPESERIYREIAQRFGAQDLEVLHSLLARLELVMRTEAQKGNEA